MATKPMTRDELMSKQPHFLEQLADKRENLGDPDVLDSLLRQFVVSMAGWRAQVNSEKMKPTEMLNLIQAEAKRLAGVFMGDDTANYVPVPWFSRKQLGAYIDSVCDNAGGPDDAAESLLLHFAAQVSAAMKAHEDDEIDDDVAKFRMEAAMEDVAMVLRGLEFPEDA